MIQTALMTILLCLGNPSTNIDFDFHIQSTISVQNLSKNWKFKKYKFWMYSEAPSQKEKNDYIHLSSNMTFTSRSMGEYDIGKWRLDTKKKRIYLSKKNATGELIFIIDDLSDKQLVLIIDDPSDSDAQYLKIYFKN